MRDRAAAERLDLADDVGGFRFVRSHIHQNVGAIVRERVRDGAADVTAGSRDDRGFALQLFRLCHLSSSSAAKRGQIDAPVEKAA